MTKQQTFSTTRAVFSVFWQHLRRYPLPAGLLIFFVLCATVASQLLEPWATKFFVDGLVRMNPLDGTVDLRELYILLAMVMGIKIIYFLFYRASGFAVQYMTPRVMADMDRASLRNLLTHSYAFFTNSFAGSLVRKIGRLSRAYDVIIDSTVWEVMPLFLTLVGILGVFFYRFPTIAWIVLAWSVVFIIVNYVVANWKLKYDQKRAEKDSEVTGTLSDIVTNWLNVKLFTGHADENARFGNVAEELRQIRQRSWNLGEINEGIQYAFIITLDVVVFVIALRMWSAGQITVGDFFLFQGYLASLTNYLRSFGRLMRNVYESIADAKEMVDILNAPRDVEDRKTARQLVLTRGKIEFQRVTFNYHRTRKVLSEFSAKIAPGEKVAFVGSSGAGKSTVVKLLFRFFDIDRGKILIDGQDISRVTQDSLRDVISLVPQEPILFHRTLMENIRYGQRSAADEEVIAAARKAHCHEFISDMPNGYDTLVGERGVKLSGGERQRVAIARAILKNSPILVLDEATSSLDSESEALIQDALRELMKNKTVIVIAHRLSTIMQMDRIIVMERGKVADAGTHRQLLGKVGIYQKLWDIQAGGFTKKEHQYASAHH